MAITRSFGSNGQFELTDWTEEITVLPNTWGTIGQLGIFGEESVAEHTVTFEKITKSFGVLVDRVRGDKHNSNTDYAREVHSIYVPHFNTSDSISPNDIQGKRAYGNANEAESIAAVRVRKMERIANTLNSTLEVARAQALTAGTVYAPSGTVTQDWFAEMGKTRTSINFQFSNSTFDVLGTVESTIAAIQDNGGLISLSSIVMLCDQKFFAALISHATVKTAYQYYASTQSPLRDRLANPGAALNSVAMHRTFDFGGIHFIEMRDTLAGTKLIPTQTAVAVPVGTDFFSTYFSPANKLFLVNTLAERQYMFEYPSMYGDDIKIEAETNFVNILKRPEIVVNLTMS